MASSGQVRHVLDQSYITRQVWRGEAQSVRGDLRNGKAGMVGAGRERFVMGEVLQALMGVAGSSYDWTAKAGLERRGAVCTGAIRHGTAGPVG